jgi:hypothetical protein
MFNTRISIDDTMSFCGRHRKNPENDSKKSEMDKKKPLICQAGSAEAFLDSAATGRELVIRLYFF